MNPLYRFLFSILVLVMPFCLPAQQVFRTTPTSVIAYLEYVPQNYASNSDKYPVVIFLHGIGERGPNTTDLATLETGIVPITKLGPPKYVKNGTQFPFILISPQLKNNYSSWPTGYVMEVINHVKTYLRIDERRIYITGLSLGGGGTWTMAQDFPTLFAAVAPVCGGYNAPAKACQIASENLPVWAFHGDADTTVPLSRSANMVNAINACSPAPNPKALLTVYPGVKHNAWDRAYAVDNSFHNPNVYQWMMNYTNTTNRGNRIPLANAGADVTTASKTTTLTGSGTDSDGTISKYQWTKIGGPAATLTNATTAKLSLSNLVAGKYTFRLTVTDNTGNTDSDYVTVTVNENAAPVVSAGPNVSITLPTNSAILKGTASDSDGTIVSYAWTKVSGSTATLTNAATATVTVSALLQGTYVFRLTVKDDKGATASSDVTVTVNPEPVTAANKPPVANAGPNVNITLPANTATIKGTGTDADGKVVSFAWTKISGGAVVMSGATTPTLTVSGVTEGYYVFRITVKDDQGASHYDDMRLNVYPDPAPAAATNVLPVANAGKDIHITLPTNSVRIVGTGTDADGTIVAFSWTKIRGGAATLSGTSTSTLSASGLTEGFYVFRLTVTDNAGGTAYDDVGVRVNAPIVTAASLGLPHETMDERSIEENQRVDISDYQNAYWRTKSITVYDDSGRSLYSGKWSEEAFRSVTHNPGLKICHIMENGQRVDVQKIYLR